MGCGPAQGIDGPIEAKRVDDVLVAGTRFTGRHDEIEERLADLVSSVGDVAGRSWMVLHHGGNQHAGWDIEVCLPVARETEGTGVETHVLPGGDMLTMTHTTSSSGADDSGSLERAWGRLWSHVRSNDIAASEGPYREIHIEDRGEGGPDSAHLVELQIPLFFGLWLDRLAAGIDRLAGSGTRQRVLEGIEASDREMSARDVADRAIRVVRALESEMDDPTLRHDIMTGCAHRFPDEPIRVLGAKLEELGSVRKLLDFMKNDETWQGATFHIDPNRKAVLTVVKVPHDREGVAAASNALEKRIAYCHCSMIRDAIRRDEEIPETHCHCAAGWYVRMWSGIVGEPVRVDLERSILHGDDCCSFAIHIPEAVW